MALMRGTLKILAEPTIRVTNITEEFLYPEIKLGDKTLTKVLVVGSMFKQDFERGTYLHNSEYELTSVNSLCLKGVLILFFSFFLYPTPTLLVLNTLAAIVFCIFARRRWQWKLNWIRNGDQVSRTY